MDKIEKSPERTLPKYPDETQSFDSEEKRAMKSFSESELERLSLYFKEWDENERPKSAFYVLTSPRRLTYLQKMLQSLDEYFNDKFKYPIIIFHEASLSAKIPIIRKFTNSTLFFQLVNFSILTFLKEPVKEDIPCLSRISYRHMCRFNAKSVYEEASVRMLDYYWRLDDDSRLISPVNYDVFVFMKKRELQYGYIWQFYDSNSCVIGLWEATGRYIQENNLQPKFFKDWPKPSLYYNNFEIASTDMWLSKEYEKYIEYLDLLGGIYYSRWGDAPIHGIAVSLFLEKNQTHHFKDIGYHHSSYTNDPQNQISQ